MQNLAYKIDVDVAESCRNSKTSQDRTDVCAACGEQLFGPDADPALVASLGLVWEIMGRRRVELVCGACGEYLQAFFKERHIQETPSWNRLLK